MRAALLPLAAVALLGSGMALAVDPASSPPPRVACKAEFEKLCPGVQPGKGRVMACLKQYEAQLSAPCQDAIAKAQAKRAAAPPAPTQ
jgi:hypothetical protein